jgi:sigma-B regulation protein RsbU (phosphoserine phosphatase)
MANVQATLRGLVLSNLAARECVARANKLLHLSTSTEKFVTLFYGALDTTAHSLTYCNAGQDPPLLFSSGASPRRLGKGGIVLSVVEEFPYEEETVGLLPGDCLVMYSDGISEAVNPDDVQFGEEGLLRVVSSSIHASAAGIIDAVVSAVRAHAGPAPQADDMTLVVIKRLRPDIHS